MSTPEHHVVGQGDETVSVAVDEKNGHEKAKSSSSLQMQVNDLQSKLGELEKKLKTLTDAKQAKVELNAEQKSDHDQAPDDADGPDSYNESDDSNESDGNSDRDAPSDDEDAAQSTARSVTWEDADVNCEPTWKLKYVRSKTDWPTELGVRYSLSDVTEKPAIVVYYERPEGSTSDPEQPPEGQLPVRIRINSRDLNKLLQDVTGLVFPRLPYTALPPYKVFVSYHEKLKETQRDFEASFTSDFKMAVDDIEEKRPSVPPSLSEFRDDSDDDDGSFKDRKRDILLLRSFVEMSEKFLGPLLSLQSRIADKSLEKISFANLWFLYQPGDIVFGKDSVGPKTWNAYQVFCVTGGRPCLKCLSHSTTKDHEPTLCDIKLHCYSWTYTGSGFSPFRKVISITPFNGEKKIKELPYFPKQLCSDTDVVLKSLISRGERFRQCRYGHGNYNGTTLPPNSWHVNEDVFIDFRSGYEFKPGWSDQDLISDITLPEHSEIDIGTFESRCGDGCKCMGSYNINDETLNFRRAERFIAKKEYILDVSNDDLDGLDENRLVMLPSKLLGYGLRSKQWFFLDPEYFELVDPSVNRRQQAFHDLVLPKRTKKLLKAMVKTHAAKVQDMESRNTESVDEIDLVKGKGKGLIIFLYGPPGVGKTSTAETIAAYSTPARPLYPITCGDLGSNPIEIQEKLDSHFTLAHRWKCVLLLDEADVYLAERDISDLSRNGIVSVFLRNLEYYSGILFLTSNREGLIDEAFKSRIHVALRYKAISMSGTERIWRNIMRKIEEDNESKRIPVTFDPDDLIEWAVEHYTTNSKRKADSTSSASTATWNGRQIRNAFQTAIALASFARLEHLEKKNYTEEEALKKKKSRYREIQLTREHFDTVATVVGEFEEYLVECRGDDAERAANALRRKDNHDPDAPHPSAFRAPNPNATPKTPKSGPKNGFRDDTDDEETSNGLMVSSPSPMRKAKGNMKEFDMGQMESDRPSRTGRRGSMNAGARKALDSSGSSDSDTD